jgi:hypothetical protein
MPLPHIDMARTLEKIEESALIQMIYVSSLTLKGRLSASMFNEVEHYARAYNEQHHITGVLCYGNGQFLQCIEGNKAQVLALQQRIFADKRHKNFKILILKVVEQRSFIDWRMRFLFLERWLWSPATKQQATQLAEFLPFAPRGWTLLRTDSFLQTIKTFDSAPHMKAAGITYSALGSMLRHIVAPHQAFLMIQGVLSLLIIVTLILLFV